MHWLDWEEPKSERPRGADLFREGVAARKKALVGAILAAPLAAALYVTFAPPQYSAEAKLFIATPPASAALAGEAKLIQSRDLARSAIKELKIDARPDFDPAADSVGLIARPLIFLGLARDPDRDGAEERLLGAFLQRLSVRAPEKNGVVKIAFRSRDGVFAAAAANSVAKHYLAMRASADATGGDPSAVSARLIAPAVPPRRPAPPDLDRVLAAAAAGAFAVALGFGAFRRRPSRSDGEESAEPPRSIGEAPPFVRLKNVPRPASPARMTAASRQAEAFNAKALDDLAARILRRGASACLRIVGSRLSFGDAGPDVILALARLSGRAGRSILIALDGDARALAVDEGRNLGDLLAGRASFAEAIRRDPASRLHFVAPGEPGPIDITELSSVIDALARTYDFIWLAAPSLEASSLARTLAADADFVVLSAPFCPRDGAIAKARADLLSCGAREVLVIGAPIPQRQFGRDAA